MCEVYKFTANVLKTSGIWYMKLGWLFMQRYYVVSAREVARVMGVEKSPILNHYGESIPGAATIRGFGQTQRFMDTNMQLCDNYARPCFLNFALIEWLTFRLELLCTIVFSFALMIVLLLPANAIDPSKSVANFSGKMFTSKTFGTYFAL